MNVQLGKKLNQQRLFQVQAVLNKTLAFISFGYFAEHLLTFAGRFLTLICHFDV